MEEYIKRNIKYIPKTLGRNIRPAEYGVKNPHTESIVIVFSKNAESHDRPNRNISPTSENVQAAPTWYRSNQRANEKHWERKRFTKGRSHQNSRFATREGKDPKFHSRNNRKRLKVQSIMLCCTDRKQALQHWTLHTQLKVECRLSHFSTLICELERQGRARSSFSSED